MYCGAIRQMSQPVVQPNAIPSVLSFQACLVLFSHTSNGSLNLLVEWTLPRQQLGNELWICSMIGNCADHCANWLPVHNLKKQKKYCVSIFTIFTLFLQYFLLWFDLKQYSSTDVLFKVGWVQVFRVRAPGNSLWRHENCIR